MVYFVQGVLGISRLAVSFYFKDELHLDPAEVCHFNKMFNGCIWIIHTFNCHFSYGVKCARMLLCIAEDLNTFFFCNKTLNNGLVVILVNILAWTTFFVMDDILICGWCELKCSFLWLRTDLYLWLPRQLLYLVSHQYHGSLNHFMDSWGAVKLVQNTFLTYFSCNKVSVSTRVFHLHCSDSLPLFGYRRRSYLVLSGLLGALSWSLMATLADSKYSAAFYILIGSLSVAFSDVVSELYYLPIIFKQKAFGVLNCVLLLIPHALYLFLPTTYFS